MARLVQILRQNARSLAAEVVDLGEVDSQEIWGSCVGEGGGVKGRRRRCGESERTYTIKTSLEPDLRPMLAGASGSSGHFRSLGSSHGGGTWEVPLLFCLPARVCIASGEAEQETRGKEIAISCISPFVL